MACLSLSARDTLAFDDLLASHPELLRVSLYRLTCKVHGVYRVLANGVLPDRCPRCSQPATLGRVRGVVCATRLPVPLVQRWRADNHDTMANTPPAWLQRSGEIEEW